MRRTNDPTSQKKIVNIPAVQTTIGYLINAFPNATILEIQRDPRDVALSMWQNFFPSMTHSYSNELCHWWTMANIDGYPQRVYCTAANAFEASNIFKSIYGNQLINEYASRA
mgnify:CR=1 FL=1